MPHFVESYLDSRGTKKDTFVVFAGNESPEYLAKACEAAKKRAAIVLGIAGDANTAILKQCTSAIPIRTSSLLQIGAMQSVFLHAVCEGCEPELLPVSEKSSRRDEVFRKAFEDSAGLDKLIAQGELASHLARARQELYLRLEKGGWAYFAGNGGSAADAIELCRALSDRRLSNGLLPRAKHFLDPCYLTCAYNDGYSPFVREMEEDRGENVLIVYSTSGQSENINAAVSRAKSQGVFTIALTGKGGGKLAGLADLSLVVPSNDTGRIQEAHAVLGAVLLA